MKSFNAISFQCLFGLYPVVRVDSLSRGFRGLNSDVFMLFGCLASVGSYGLTARGCCGMLFNSYADSNQRSTRYRLKWLCDAGYIVKFSYKGRVRYRLSSHAEKLIVKSIGKQQLRDIALFVKDSIKQ